MNIRDENVKLYEVQVDTYANPANIKKLYNCQRMRSVSIDMTLRELLADSSLFMVPKSSGENYMLNVYCCVGKEVR